MVGGVCCWGDWNSCLEVGSRSDLKPVGRVVGVLICGKGMMGDLEPDIRLDDDVCAL